MNVYICVDEEGSCETGKTLVEAWRNYERNVSNFGVADLQFYKAEQVEIDIIEKPVIVKTPVAKKPTAKK